MSFGKKNKFGHNIKLQSHVKSNESIFTNSKKIHNIDINLILSNPYQPRLENGDISDLKDSINRLGLLHPLNVVKNDNDTFTLISGHRRLEALKLLGKETVEVIINHNEKDLQLKSLAENLQRKNLEPLELAFTYKDIIDTYNLSYAQLSQEINKSQSHISQILNILKLSDEIILKIKEDKYSNLLVLNKLNQVKIEAQVNIYNNIKHMIREEAIKYIENYLINTQEIISNYLKISNKGNKYNVQLDIDIMNDEQKKETIIELYKIIEKIKGDN